MKIDPTVSYMRLSTTLMGLEIHVKFNGRMRLTRTAKPKLLLQIATEYTGKVYKNNRGGHEAAIADMKAKKAELLAARPLNHQP